MLWLVIIFIHSLILVVVTRVKLFVMVGVVLEFLGIECRGRKELNQLRESTLLSDHVLNCVDDERRQDTVYWSSFLFRHLSESSITFEKNLVDAEAMITVQVGH